MGIQHVLCHVLRHLCEDLLHVGQPEALFGQHLVHGGDAEDAVDTLAQRLPCVYPVPLPQLEAQEHGDGLQVVLHTMMHLAHDGGIDHQAGVLNSQGGLVGQRLKQPDLLRSEGAMLTRVAVEDADDSLPHPQWHAEE